MIEKLKEIFNRINQFDISKNSLCYLNALVFDLQECIKDTQTIYGKILRCIFMKNKIVMFKNFINEIDNTNYQKNNQYFIKFINNKKNEFVYKIKNDINMLEQEVQKRRIINKQEAYTFSTDTKPIKLPKEETKEINLKLEEEEYMRALENMQRNKFGGGYYYLDQEQEKKFQEWKKGIDKYYKELHEKAMLSNQQKHIIELPKIEQRLFIDNQEIKIKKLKKKNIDYLINVHNQVFRPIYQQQMDSAIKKIEKEAKKVGRRVYLKETDKLEGQYDVLRLNNGINNLHFTMLNNAIIHPNIHTYKQ